MSSETDLTIFMSLSLAFLVKLYWNNLYNSVRYSISPILDSLCLCLFDGECGHPSHYISSLCLLCVTHSSLPSVKSDLDKYLQSIQEWVSGNLDSSTVYMTFFKLFNLICFFFWYLCSLWKSNLTYYFYTKYSSLSIFPSFKSNTLFCVVIHFHCSLESCH